MNTHTTGNGYIAYARCASTESAKTKLDRQICTVRQYGHELGMRCVDEIRLAGVGGGPPAMRDELHTLLVRKQNQDDFSALIMEDFTRLTRVGIAEGIEVMQIFARCGVQILYASPGTELHSLSWRDDIQLP